MVKGYARKVKYTLLFIVLAGFSAVLIIFPERYITACSDGLKMWAVCVVPSLFPFMVVCALLTNTGLAAKAALPLKKITGIFKLPPCAAPCFIMAAMSGYPAGSRIVSGFYSDGYINTDGAKKLACLCSATGPLFAIGTVGVNMFGSSLTGIKLFISHIIAVLFVSIIYSLFTPYPQGKIQKTRLKGNVLGESFYGSVTAVLTAGAFIVFFYTAAAVISDLNILYPVKWLITLFAGTDVAKAVCTGLVEMTGGCAFIAKTGSIFALPFAGFMVTFGGACILLQQLCYLAPLGVKPAKFILQKFLQGIVCFIILFFIQ